MQQDHLNQLADHRFSGELIYELFCHRLESGWLIEIPGETIIALATEKLALFTQIQPNFISIATHNPIEFIAELMVGWRLGIPIFLCNPQWGTAEWQEVNILTAQVDLNRDRDLILIPTGGSGGKIKFAIHNWQTLSASVWGFQEFYGVDRLNFVCVLPLYHVSGLMQLLRSLLTDGQLFITDYHQFYTKHHSLSQQIESDKFFISLVPTQLHKLLEICPIWLSKFKTILLGGAPPSLELLDRARKFQIPLALTYGMTETASQITSLQPAQFLAGNNSCGQILPHAQIIFQNDLTKQVITSANANFGVIQIQAKSLMLGYFPHLDSTTYFETDDLGSIDDQGYLTILGRNSGKIITGGENVLPIEVVRAILATGLVLDAWVVGLPDTYWGQVVVALYVPGNLLVSPAQLVSALTGKISSYKIPKYWLAIEQIPRNYLGKILNQEVARLAQKLYDSK